MADYYLFGIGVVLLILVGVFCYLNYQKQPDLKDWADDSDYR